MGAALAVWLFWQMETAYLLCWLLGAAGFWLRDRVQPVRGRVAAAGALVLLAGTLIYQADLGILAPAPGIPLPSPYPAQVIVAAGALLLIAALMSMAPTTVQGRWIERRGTLLAAASYTLYLTHYPVVYLLALRAGRMPPEFSAASVGRAVSWMSLCAVVAWVMYALFEARTPSVRRRLRTWFAGAG